ncbi:MAG: methylmalonyl-CoA epimerase [Flavobacteriales bacterium]|jgi:methylmalonyl-CoA/ethylmalonyl-CoA epimerase|nr:methylmalonyl-CoA epimerase [Flavobacteriales bacterium]|tara:strand:- start:59446 stop:59847 length:402 start_codon:yes stop_codon:yes gene_type:complete
MKKIEHIGIAVSNLEEANKLYSSLLNTKPYKQETVDSEGVVTSFFTCKDTKIELIQGIGENNSIAKFISKNGEGIHHIAFEVDDIIYEMKRLKKLGFKVINDVPKKGADNKLICFIHPKSTNYVLIELCQKIK